jgi:hypothetical protein
LGFSEALSALGRSSFGYAAGIDHDEVRFPGRLGLAKSELFEQLSNLLAFVLVNLAAKGIYGKGRHNVI